MNQWEDRDKVISLGNSPDCWYFDEAPAEHYIHPDVFQVLEALQWQAARIRQLEGELARAIGRGAV